MNKDDNLFNSYDTAFLVSAVSGLIRLISIITTFFIWLCLSVFLLVFLRLKMISLDQLSGLNQVLGVFGLSPVLLTVFSWRIIEKIYSYYLQKYADNHTKPKESS